MEVPSVACSVGFTEGSKVACPVGFVEGSKVACLLGFVEGSSGSSCLLRLPISRQSKQPAGFVEGSKVACLGFVEDSGSCCLLRLPINRQSKQQVVILVRPYTNQGPTQEQLLHDWNVIIISLAAVT